MLSVKGWDQFQHYKTGRGCPPWIKLHRNLLNNPAWFDLGGDEAKFLINCWMLAAENDGNLPDIKTLAFRLRLDSKKITALVSACSEWIIDDASTVLASCYQVAIPEEEKEEEKEKNIVSAMPPRRVQADRFTEFWSAYPRKVSKSEALKIWQRYKLDAIAQEVLDGLESYRVCDQWVRDEGKYIPHPTTWLRQRRWEDEIDSAQPRNNTHDCIPAWMTVLEAV